MSGPVFTLYETVFVVFGMLPVIFFQGTPNVKWFVTAVPFFFFPVVMPLAYLDVFEALTPDGWRPALEVVSVFPAVGSLALVFLTLGTHRTRLALWHQDNDAPSSIVTYGAYGRIRHPFYTAFLIAFAGAAVAFPHWATVPLFLYAVVLLNTTASREERRLSVSAFGSEYRDYITRTGRFVPRPAARRVEAEVGS